MSQQASAQSYYYAGLAAVVLVIIAAGWLLFRDTEQVTEPAPLPPVVEPATPQQPLEAEPLPEPAVTEPAPVAEPVEAAATPAEPEVVVPLPALDESDTELAEALLALNWKAGLAALFNREEMIRNLVVTVDNIAQGQLVAGHPVLAKPADGYRVQPVAEGRYLTAADNSSRYEPYLQLLESVPPRQVLALKRHYQPLLDQAFAELGYPDLTFDQRLRQAIAVLLSTPQVPAGAELSRPSVMYTYADPKLEQLPEAQKQVLRLSAEQQQRFKALLTTYQQALGN